jgi:glycosyltransferase involved in cell wall biosynthesis
MVEQGFGVVLPASVTGSLAASVAAGQMTWAQLAAAAIGLGGDAGDTLTNRAAAAGQRDAEREIRLTRADEVITFVNRNLEPYRGYHIFMRAWPEVLRHRPRAHVVVVVCGNGVSYGAAPPKGSAWLEIFLE